MNAFIKKMEPEHLEDVVAIETSSFPAPWTRKFFSQDIDAYYGRNFVSVLDRGTGEKVLGYITAWVVYDECTINKIACDCSYRRRGIGSALLNHLIKEVYIQGVKYFFLETRQLNTAAVSFYQEFGFIRKSIRKGYYSDTKEDAIVMELYVSEPVECEGDVKAAALNF